MNPLYFPPRRDKPRVGWRGRLLTLLLAAILLVLAVGRALAAAGDPLVVADHFYDLAGWSSDGQAVRFHDLAKAGETGFSGASRGVARFFCQSLRPSGEPIRRLPFQ